MQLHINPHDEIPVYRQIRLQIAKAIADRRLRPGEVLQSEDQLAAQLVISPTAVRKAYQSLAAAGLCTTTQDGSCRVTAPALGSAPDRGTDLAPAFVHRELLAEELQSARAVQRRLLPPSELQGETWAVSSRSYLAGALAGDFYDVFELQDGRLGIVVADVSGKGLAAGLVMATVRSILPFVAKDRSAASTLAELNAHLYPILDRREFVALVYTRFDPVTGGVEIANAGLPDPYLLQARGSMEVLSVGGSRLPLGVREVADYSVITRTLETHDRLLFITDGLPEATDQDGDPIGYERFDGILQAILQREGPARLDDRVAEPLLDRLLEKVSRLTGSILEDDWTAMLLEYRGC